MSVLVLVRDLVSSACGIFKALALWADAFYKSICPSVCLYVCPSVCLSVCVFTFEVPFKHIFAPTYRSRMSNIFTDSESLGKRYGKKWSQIWTFLFENCWKSPHKKKFFFSTFFTFFLIFFGFRSFLTVFLLPLPKVGCPIFLQIRNPWGKVMERSGLRYEDFCLKNVENRVTKKSFFLHFFWSSSVFGLF